ncbi:MULTISPECIES: PTS sugar transporter subunit IIB [Lysinibacillus]|uniref:PTS lactose transporter subunit IIB n=1 Tax=Lysinibacillus xylanilyticus TaxID=582475 RepID=A0A0K9FF75_9BACI|nr:MULTISPECIES: PTS sugar transporter subunit IIB [Lysinibacillus]KMY33125.1 PTS lactose transporter subunit IIB [Lysinibacillus xylanilyticus]KOP80728.1 PTS lactose transporter subunit IIB [Lysinibacillus sp. FJAT-14745]
MKILVVCGNGLGSSFIMELNVKKALTELGKVAEVTHTDLASAKAEKADIYIGAEDIVNQLGEERGHIVSIVNMMSISEIKSKLKPLL